jgi:fructosamine-3-kinase
MEINRFAPLPADILSEYTGVKERILEWYSLTGGDINANYRVVTSAQNTYFIKINSLSFLDMLQKEAKALKELSDSRTFRIPRVIAVGRRWNMAYLVLEYITPSQGKPAVFAELLAEMHSHRKPYHGWEVDNYIGTLSQRNTNKQSWIDFYITERLKPQSELAFQKGLISGAYLDILESFYRRLYEILPDSPASLLHGDLWNGNYFYDSAGTPVLIDPAIYYGNREMDLAMMRLFGGFDIRIFEIYNQIYPLEQGWEERIPIYQLYPLWVHVNLFGGSYLNRVKQIITKWIC